MHRFSLGAILALGTLLVLCAPAYPQEHPAVDRGYSPDKLFQLSNLDQVNLLNGGVSERIPIGLTFPVGGSFSYGLTLTYSSKVWDFEEILNPSPSGPTYLVRSLPAQHANAGLSWTLTLGKLIDPQDPSNETGRWQYLDRMGGRSSFFPTLLPTDSAQAGVSYTRDSRYLRMKEIAGGKRTVEFRNGEIHTFSAAGLLERMEDRYGNYLTITHGSSQWDLTDRQGRTHTVFFKTVTSDGQSIQVVDRVELAAFGGTTATYTFDYESAMIPPACTDTFRGPGAQIEVQLLSSITLPDGSSFVPTYYRTGCSGGLLESLTLPTLGRIEYHYGIYVLPTEGCAVSENLTWAQRTNGVTSRIFFDAAGTELGRWQYQQSLLGPPATPTGLCTGTDEDPSEVSQTVVMTPNGDSFHYLFSVWPNLLPIGGSPNGFKVQEYGLPIDRTRTDSTGNRYLSQELYEDGVLKRQIYVRYEYENPCSGNSKSEICDESNRRLVSQRTVYQDDSGRYADVTFSDDDGAGHYRMVTTGGSFPSGNVRTTFTNYNPGHDLVLDANLVPQPGYVMWPTTAPWVLETYSEQTVSEGGQTAKTQSCFNGATGSLLRTRMMLGTTPSQDDVIASFTPDGDGNVASEEYLGGDVQTVSTSSNLCGLNLPSSQYRLAHTYSSGSLATSRYTNGDGTGVGFVSTNLTIDANTGLVAASQDPAGLVTSYEYDAMGRLRWEKPQAGHGAWTQYVPTRATSATSPAKVQILHRANGSESGTILAQEEVWFDGFGRVWKERRLMPGGWVVRETLYDAMGQKTRVSEWADEDAVPFVQHWTEYMEYDAFGRVGRIRPPDGAAHDVTMTYIGDRVVQRRVQVATSLAAESTALTVERYDRQGRLYQVVEPSGANNANVTTTYSYDVGNRLNQVSTSAEGTTQIRRFNYDLRGLLLSEEHPEKDGSVTYSKYDARGHAGRKVDGPNDLTFTYDRAERLLEIKETVGLKRPWKKFEYATTVAANDWRKGKLLKATRYNYYEVGPVKPPGQIFADDFECGDLSSWSAAEGAAGGGGIGQPSCKTISYDVAVEETYKYGGVSGRVSQRDTAITLNGNTGETFTQGWTYTDLGDVASVSYPKCNFSRCTSDGAGTTRTVSPTYTRGYLTAVPGYASSITYHPSGLVNKITHTNGVVVTQAADPDGMARPASIEAKRGSTTHWKTGTYAYDGAANITQIGSASFLYDKVSRLTTASLPTDRLGTGTLEQQSYSYDSFGNLQEITGSPGLSTATDSATNRLQGTAVYDAPGNLTSWNGNEYQYDAFNMMRRLIAGDEDWLYVYTADDERIWQFRRTFGSSYSRYTLRDLSGKVLRQYKSTSDFWVVEEDYVYRGDLLLAAQTPAGARHFHLDHLGTPRLITGSSGERVAFHTYYPFGEEATDPFQDEERMKFTGHERDLADPGGAGDDLDYMMARFCSPVTGRFMSVDPSSKSVSLGLPESWNRYAYSFNNPLRFVDPSGEAAVVEIDEEESTITITAEIDIWGNMATDEIAADIEMSIEQEWSGHTYIDPETGTEYDVSIDVNVRNVGAEKKNATAPNRIKIDSHPGKEGRDFVNTRGRIDTGAWKPNSPGKVRAHEFGHLMGLKDDYFRRSGRPKPGHFRHLMSTSDTYSAWKVDPHEVKDVVSKSVSIYDRTGKTVHRIN